MDLKSDWAAGSGDGFALVETNGACPKHADRPRLGTCSRCGSFVCIVCCPQFAEAPTEPCEACGALLAAVAAPRGRRNSLNAAGGSALLFSGGVFLADVSATPVIAVLFAVVPAVLGLLVLVTRIRQFAYAFAVIGGAIALLHLPSLFLTGVFLSLALASYRLADQSVEAPPEPSSGEP